MRLLLITELQDIELVMDGKCTSIIFSHCEMVPLFTISTFSACNICQTFRKCKVPCQQHKRRSCQHRRMESADHLMNRCPRHAVA